MNVIAISDITDKKIVEGLLKERIRNITWLKNVVLTTLQDI